MDLSSKSKEYNSRIRPLSIDDHLYLLALVYTNEIEQLRTLINKAQFEYDINLNYSFNLPIDDINNIMEELSQLVIVNGYFRNINDFINRNKLIKRLMKYYNIDKLNSNLSNFLRSNYSDQYDENNSLSSSSSSDSQSSLDSPFEFRFENYMRATITTNTNQDAEIDEIVNDAIQNNKFFDITLLHVAILLENNDMINFLLRYGASIGPFRPNNISSIHFALYENNNSILQLLLSQLTQDQIEYGTLNHLTDDRGYNPLHVAIYYSNEEAIDLLYTHGANINYENATTSCALVWALENIDIPYMLIQRLLYMCANPNVIDKTNGYTPLILAILADRFDLVKLLVRYGAHLNTICDNQAACCALQLAIDRANQNNDYEIVKFLLKCGANTTFYVTANNRSQTQGNPTAANQNEIENNRVNQFGGPLIDAINLNNKIIAEMLLMNGSNGNTIATGTYSPMCTACFLGRYEMVELLLKYNVDPTVSCKTSNTPLTVAISMNHHKIVDLLLPYYNNEKINKCDTNGDHALLYAALNKNSNLVQKLLKTGANANLANKFDTNALWYCAYNADVDSFAALMPYIKEFNTASCGVEYNGFQFPPTLIYPEAILPIELAAQKGCYEIVYALKVLGAKVPVSVIDCFKTKLKELEDNIKTKKIESTIETQIEINKLMTIIDFLKTPLSLKRLCRIFHFENKLVESTLLKNVPECLKEFLLVKIK